MTGPVIIEKVKSVYDEMEITDKYTFLRYRYCLTIQNIGQFAICLVSWVLNARNSTVNNCCKCYFILYL